MNTQPINTQVIFDDGECRMLYLARSAKTYQMIQEIYPKSVVEVLIEGNTCIITAVNPKTGNQYAFTTFNMKTLRVAPTGCPLDHMDVKVIRNDIYHIE